MKRTSKLAALLGLFGLTAAAPLWAADSTGVSDLFAVVQAQDATYAQLDQLEKAGLLPAGSSRAPLTRYEVAEDILTAKNRYQQIALASDDAAMLPSVDDLSAATTSAPAPDAGTSASAAAAPVTESDEDLQKAALSLGSLQEAYQYELKAVQGSKDSVLKDADGLNAAQYDIWKRLKGIEEYPTVAWHGLGRAFLINQQYYGDTSALGLTHSSTHTQWAYLDFKPEGVVDKEIRWNIILRYQSQLESTQSAAIDLLTVRRATMDYNAPWLSATLGDFDEAYTPLTLWNRDNLDLEYMPEMIAREDDTLKYESFLNDEPKWPFRGARVGTALLWPDSDLLDRFSVSGLASLIRNGFNDTSGQAFYFGPSNFSDFIFGAKAELKSKRWYLGGASVQLTLDGYAVVLAQPLGTNTPNSIYVQFNPDTWAHHYQTASEKHSIDIGLGDDASLGGTWENSEAVYQDDTRDNNKIVEDYAILAGPYFKFGHSKISLSFLHVGPYYYSPLAQTRQDDVTSTSLTAGGAVTPDLFTAPLVSQFFLNDIPRAGGIFTFYDRTQDNTFPYGLATPNRQGGGIDLDVKTLEKDALQIKGAAYLVQEISDNLVEQGTPGGYVPVAVDGTGAASTPIRNFVYVNLGPSLNLAPSLGLTQDLIVGVNARFEQTSSSIGTLTSAWFLGGAQVGLFPWWEMAASYSDQEINGSEAGMNGTTLARYSYIFDDSDLGSYSVFTINGSNQSLRLSSVFNIDRHSKLALDYDLTGGTAVPYVGALPPGQKVNNQYAEVTYEIQF
jgi:hypothetical protein